MERDKALRQQCSWTLIKRLLEGRLKSKCVLYDGPLLLPLVAKMLVWHIYYKSYYVCARMRSRLRQITILRKKIMSGILLLMCGIVAPFACGGGAFPQYAIHADTGSKICPSPRQTKLPHCRCSCKSENRNRKQFFSGNNASDPCSGIQSCRIGNKITIEGVGSILQPNKARVLKRLTGQRRRFENKRLANFCRQLPSCTTSTPGCGLPASWRPSRKTITLSSTVILPVKQKWKTAGSLRRIDRQRRGIHGAGRRRYGPSDCWISKAKVSGSLRLFQQNAHRWCGYQRQQIFFRHPEWQKYTAVSLVRQPQRQPVFYQVGKIRRGRFELAKNNKKESCIYFCKGCRH